MDRDAALWRLRRPDAVALLVLFVVAFGIRLGMVLASPGGLLGNLGDDSAAYYAGADALVHGRLPYRDFVLLHPPLYDLVLTPFAAIGSLTSDHAGFIAATLAGEAVGAGCAVLVIVVARRFGLGRVASYVAGVFYAVWYGAVAGDVGIRLEGFATLLTLLGLLALTGEQRRRNLLLGGAAFGAAATVKIWGVVPVVVLVIWFLAFGRTRRSVPTFVAGAVGAAVVVCGPFFVASPTSMWHMVVTDQLTRRAGRGSRLQRMSGLGDVFPDLHGNLFRVTIVAIVLVLVTVLALAARVEATRVIVVIAVVELVVLYTSPSFYMNYSNFVAVALALTVGAAAHGVRTPGVRTTRTVGVAAVVLAVLWAGTLSAGALTDVPATVRSYPFPDALMAEAVDGAHCPTPDGPIVLIVTDTLSRTLADGCPNWIDVTGRVYDVDKAPQGADYPRVKNARWQRSLRRYLLSGDTVIVFRPRLGIGPALNAELARLPLIGRKDGFTAWRVRPSHRGQTSGVSPVRVR